MKPNLRMARVMCMALVLGGIMTLVFGIRLARADALPAAAPRAVESVGIPGFDTCPKESPLPELPREGLPGIFLEEPVVQWAPAFDYQKEYPAPAKTNELFGTSGMGGMMPFSYDQGCNFMDASAHLNAWTDREFSLYPVAFGQAFTALGDSIDRKAWQPSWITDLLGDLSNRASAAIETKVLLPFLGLGLLATTVMLLRASSRGNTAAVAQAVAWSLVVLLIGGFILWSPTKAATSVQAGTGSVVGGLYGNDATRDLSPSQASTETIMETIHYNGWLRRTFGSDSSDTARYYGPLLLASTRFTWAEWAATDPDRQGVTDEAGRKALLQQRLEIIKGKQKQFANITADIKAYDPIAYQWVKGGQGSVLSAWFEFGYAFFASGLRFAADLLLMLACIFLVGVGIVWLLSSALLVTPWGESMGRGLLNTSARAVGYAVMAGLASWLWSLYAGVIMAPGDSTWWGFILLGAGAFIFWTVLRPDRKAIALLSAGQVRGNGRWTRWAFGKILTGVGAGWAATKTQAHAERQQWRDAAQADRDRRDAQRLPVGWTDEDEAAYAAYFAAPEHATTSTGRIDTRYVPLGPDGQPVPEGQPIPAARPAWGSYTAPENFRDSRPMPEAGPAGPMDDPNAPVPPPAGTTGGGWWRGRSATRETGPSENADSTEWWKR